MRVLSGRTADSFGVRPLCKLLGITPQDYYKTNWDREGMDEIRKKSFIEYVRNLRQLDPGIGSKKAIHKYNTEVDRNEHVGRDKGLQWLAEEGLCNGTKKVKKPRTTDSSHDLKTYPNLTDSLVSSRFGEVIVSDITYVRLRNSNPSFCYLTLIMDSYSREVLGWAVGDTMEAKHSVRALEMAIGVLEAKKVDMTQTIHHSDCGVQFASAEYTGLLKQKGMKISMAKGSPLKNARAERVNGTFKNELLKGKKFTDTMELWKSTIMAVYFYNEERPHLSLGLLTPSQVADGVPIPKLMWHSFRTDAIMRNQGKVLVKFTQSVQWPTAGPDYRPCSAPLHYPTNLAQSLGNFMPDFLIRKQEKKCRMTITPKLAGVLA